MKKNVILCVDDEQIVLNSLKKQLKVGFDKDFMVEVAESGEEALQLFKELKEEGYKIPILISDYSMPGMKGDELLKYIFKLSPKTMSILLTGQASVESVRYAVNHGNLFRYLVKPWFAEELITTIKQAYKTYSQEKEILRQHKELFALNTQLEQKVAERTKELAKKNEELQEMNEEKDNLMGVVAHDLKSPLNQIRGIMEVLDLLGNLNSEQRNFLNIAHQIIANGENLIRDILDINAFEHQESKLALVETKLNEVVLVTVENFKQEAQKKDIEILFEYDKEIAFQTDRRFIERILNNLLSNAIKFSPRDRKIYVKTWEIEGKVHFYVKDEGQGMTDDDKSKLFKKFQKLSARPTAGENSTGLGLSIIKALVDKLQGEIKVESKVGIGTTFEIILDKHLEE